MTEREATFADRHIGPTEAEQQQMLAALGLDSLVALVDAAVPDAIRQTDALTLPAARTEPETVARLRELADRNAALTSLIGMGYSDTVTPPVIQRNVLENPAWYTAYTPYQPEISQGRLEALLNFQTMVSDLTGMDLANASLLDEPTSAAEAMAMCRRLRRDAGPRFLVDADCHPQTIDVVRTRADPIGIEVEVVDFRGGFDESDAFGALLQFPGSSGAVRDHRALVEQLHAAGALVTVAADLLALVLLKPPGEWGADVVVGSAQRFGVPLGFGGPHAGYLATRDEHQRTLPGRLVGVSVDAGGRTALRLALQTREQHIRREKATSNICTAQVLLAVMAGLYATYHGPEGLRAIATRVHRLAVALAGSLRASGVEVSSEHFFDTITVRVPGRAAAVADRARVDGINLRVIDGDTLGIALDETTTPAIIERVWSAFGAAAVGVEDEPDALPSDFVRASSILEHPVFHRYHSETEMLRYLRRLADRDLALDRTMIPLGSCTMKLNATTEMVPVTWPAFADMHPFAPIDQAAGYLELFAELESALCEITGYDAVSLQPNAGSQGELAGLLAIRRYHAERGEEGRDVCLIPASAHGTNAASAAMAGLRVVVVACDDEGNVDIDDLKHKADTAGDRLAALMVTYPSTHGVFEARIGEICDLVHEFGGQVYLDGANLNALVGIARPGHFGADVSHLNLHKTFCIPHGGGGPGVGPVAVRAHLAPYLPGRPQPRRAGPQPGSRQRRLGRSPQEPEPAEATQGIGVISGAPWGSAGILPISWAYIALMGPDGLRRATEVAVLNANYIARRLRDAYPILYGGPGGLVAHECIVDLRPITKATDVTVEDVAKRLIDFGFHSPTMSFPVAGTLMIEPTESESKPELDRFCDAMLAIREEIRGVERGEWPVGDSPLRHAPHPAVDVATDQWARPYSRDQAAFPPGRQGDKYWPPVSRIDNAYGDRNVMCACPPVEAWVD